MAAGNAEGRGAETAAAVSAPHATVERALLLLIALLVAKRLAYHLTYLVGDPFALATFSDGYVYEQAARDILQHPPLGSQPFYLQGLYAYLLAVPMAFTGQVVSALLAQIVIAALALWLFHRTAVAVFGATAGMLSTLVLLGYHELAFYENKYLSVSLGVSCNVLALWAAVRCVLRPSPPGMLGAGAAVGLAMLARPNLIAAAPFTAAALSITARAAQRPALRAVLIFSLGMLLALAPMALRNQLVIGRAEVYPSHAGAIPFFIGNNPHANGRWNTAGGLLSGQVGLERFELARELGISARDPAELDRSVAVALTERALRFIREQPAAWLALQAKKLWLTVGNHRFVRDYDARGEAELIGSGWHALALPFGVLLGLGALGMVVLVRRAVRMRGERARLLPIALVLAGQLVAVLAANVLVFTTAQNRLPLCVPLAFVAGPAVLALLAAARRSAHPIWQAPRWALAACALLTAQAFVPRSAQADRPSSAHHYNLAAAFEAIGRLPQAAEHYGRAVARQPEQPVFRLSHARVLRRLGRRDEAEAELRALQNVRDVPEPVRAAADAELRALREGSRR